MAIDLGERVRTTCMDELRHEGRQVERARAVVEVLRRRGFALTDEEAQRMTECRDQATLTRWRERAEQTASPQTTCSCRERISQLR